MLRDGSIDVNESTWAGAGKGRSWQELDRELRAFARRRCALDAEEAVVLRAAVRAEIWRELGKGSMLEYLEEVLGYAPRAAQERVRVAIAIDELPELAEALATGELHWSAVRELTRIVTPMTQAEWLENARGKNLRQLEQAVAGRKKGDKPTDPPDPDLKPRVVRFELKPATWALLREVAKVLADERGGRLDDDSLITAMCNAILGTGGDDVSGRAKYQIMTIVCEGCGQGYQDAGGRRVAIEPAAVERAECDAQRIGSDRAPQRATQDITPKTQRFVRRRDGGKCCVPGCRASRYLDIHHVVPRAAGGSHEAENLTLLCDGHHRALHEHKLTITGKAPKLEVRWAHHAHVGAARDTRTDRADEAAGRQPRASTFAFVALKNQVKEALVQMKFKKHEATHAVETAAVTVGPDATLETLLRESLRCCPRPTS